MKRMKRKCINVHKNTQNMNTTLKHMSSFPVQFEQRNSFVAYQSLAITYLCGREQVLTSNPAQLEPSMMFFHQKEAPI